MAGFGLIKIFADTNILHASQAHLLIATKVSQYIAEHQRIESIELKWMLPRMVVEERRHQMVQAALALGPKISELEKLIGHSLAISEEVMADRVDSKIRKGVEDLGIEICELDCEQVNWGSIVSKSAKRELPFELSGEKEKGFRDAVIAETFFQEHNRSPTTPRSCLLVFITGDKNLKKYIENRTNQAKNVRLLDSLDDLKSLLNAIASEITEEFLKDIFPKAAKLFYNFDDHEGLYKKGRVFEAISEEFPMELAEVVHEFTGGMRVDDGVALGDQTFIRKEGQTVVWSTEVIRKFKIVREKPLADLAGLLSASKSSAAGLGLPERQVLATGKSRFWVEWQHQITTTGKVSKAKVNNVVYDGYEIDDAEAIKF
jgi:hypothetical protein